jgi:long-chain fatty acid transport protein
MFAPANDMDCGCTLPMTGGPESINIGMKQWEVEASYAWRF